ncbi:MAG: hypothetical protein AAFX50_20820, partial [Acidobacteriota bacterium]
MEVRFGALSFRSRQETEAFLLGADPQRLVAILVQRLHHLERQAARIAFGIGEAPESRLPRRQLVGVQTGEPAGTPGADPQIASMIDQKRIDLVVVQTLRIRRVMAETIEARPTVERREAQQTAPGADPEAPGTTFIAILGEGIDRFG